MQVIITVTNTSSTATSWGAHNTALNQNESATYVADTTVGSNNPVLEVNADSGALQVDLSSTGNVDALRAAFQPNIPTQLRIDEAQVAW